VLNKISKYKKDAMLYLLIIALGIYLDQLTKQLAVTYLMPIGDFPIIEGVFHLTYAENPGAAFGILSDSRWVFMTFSSVMIVGMCVYLFYPKKEAGRFFSVGMALVISGGVGNMIDRVCLEYVIDFLYFKLINFAIFNAADSFVCIGGGMMLLSLLIDIIKEVRLRKK